MSDLRPISASKAAGVMLEYWRSVAYMVMVLPGRAMATGVSSNWRSVVIPVVQGIRMSRRNPGGSPHQGATGGGRPQGKGGVSSSLQSEVKAL
jgi:hypothetical protein